MKNKNFSCPEYGVSLPNSELSQSPLGNEVKRYLEYAAQAK